MGKGEELTVEDSHNTYSPEATEVNTSTPGSTSRISLGSCVSLLSGLRSKFRRPEASPPSNAQRDLPIADLLKARVCFGAPSGRFSLVLGN